MKKIKKTKRKRPKKVEKCVLCGENYHGKCRDYTNFHRRNVAQHVESVEYLLGCITIALADKRDEAAQRDAHLALTQMGNLLSSAAILINYKAKYGTK